MGGSYVHEGLYSPSSKTCEGRQIYINSRNYTMYYVDRVEFQGWFMSRDACNVTRGVGRLETSDPSPVGIWDALSPNKTFQAGYTMDVKCSTETTNTVLESSCIKLYVDRRGKSSDYEGNYYPISSTCNDRSAFKHTTSSGDVYYLYYHVEDVLFYGDFYGWALSDVLCDDTGYARRVSTSTSPTGKYQTVDPILREWTYSYYPLHITCLASTSSGSSGNNSGATKKTTLSWWQILCVVGGAIIGVIVCGVMGKRKRNARLQQQQQQRPTESNTAIFVLESHTYHVGNHGNQPRNQPAIKQ